MIDATPSLFLSPCPLCQSAAIMDFITADKRLIEASLARVDRFTKDRHIGIIHSTGDPLTQTRAVAVRFSIQPSRRNSCPDPRQKLFRRFLSLQQSK
jgi:hypothetical protein